MIPIPKRRVERTLQRIGGIHEQNLFDKMKAMKLELGHRAPPQNGVSQFCCICVVAWPRGLLYVRACSCCGCVLIHGSTVYHENDELGSCRSVDIYFNRTSARRFTEDLDFFGA